MREVLALDSSKSFASIQCTLFMKYAAKVELQRATGEVRRKNFLELIMVRSFKNQLRDLAMQWKNLFSYMSYQRAVKRQAKEEEKLK